MVSKVDYCISLLAGISGSLQNRLWLITWYWMPLLGSYAQLGIQNIIYNPIASGTSLVASSREQSHTISGCRSLSQSSGGQFLRAGRSRKPQICRWTCHPICHSSSDISISGFDGHIAISGCRSLSQSLGDTLFGLTMVENTVPDLPLEFRR